MAYAMVPEDGFSTVEQLGDWLSGGGKHAAIAIVTRALLRSLPNFADASKDKSFNAIIERVVLPFFRAAYISNFYTLWPTYERLQIPSYASGHAFKYAALHDRIPSNIGDKYPEFINLSNAAWNAVHAVYSPEFNNGFSRYASEAIFTSNIGWLKNEFYTDCRTLFVAISPSDMNTRPLWLQNGFEALFVRKWQQLKENLLELNENWQVWTDWYEARLRGDPQNPELEYARVTELTEEDWEKGAKHVNAKIKAIIERFEHAEIKLPPQDPTAETFGLDEHGKITVTTPTEGMHLEDTPDQKNWYGELRNAVQELAAKSDNQLGAVAGPISSLQEALPEKIADAIIARVWSRANRLRVLLKRHDEALKNPDYAHEKLDPSIATEVEHITGLFSNLAIGDAGLRNAEEGAKGPQSESEIEEADKIARPIIEDAIAAGITDDLATEVLQGILPDNQLYSGSVSEYLQKRQNQKTRNNFIAALLVAPSLVAAGALNQAGSDAYLFLIKHAPEALSFVAKVWPSLYPAIEKLLGSLG